jgi:hypothetical protein
MPSTGREQQRGGVLLELVLILPMLIFIAVLGVEFARQLRYTKIAMGLSKEAANLAYRECADIKTMVTTPCLQMVEAKMSRFADNIVPGATIRVAVSINDGVNTYERILPAAGPGCTAAGGLTALANVHQVAVCGRSRVPYNPLIRFLNRLLHFSFTAGRCNPGSATDERICFEDETVI